MTREEIQMLAFEIISYAGDSLSLNFEALNKAKKGDFEACSALQKQAADSMQEAHHLQTSLISGETEETGIDVPLIMVHAQDHLMNAVLAVKLVQELIDLYKDPPMKKN